MNIDFPLFICAKDTGEVERFDSVCELQSELEEIDVENAEYLAWDKHGSPVSLSVQKPVWLKLELQPTLDQPKLKTCLQKYAARVGVDIALNEPSEQEFSRAYQQLETDLKQRVRPSLFKRLMRRPF
jgi:hypothetical protein